MQIWITHPAIAVPLAMPDTATADITLRRLQKFRVEPGRTYRWQLSRDGRPLVSGGVRADATHLLTIPRVTLSVTPTELSVTSDAP